MRKAFYKRGLSPRSVAELFGQVLVMPANKNELNIQVRLVHSAGYIFHLFGTLPAKHDQAGRQGPIQSQLLALVAIYTSWIVEARVNDHSRSTENLLCWNACVL